MCKIGYYAVAGKVFETKMVRYFGDALVSWAPPRTITNNKQTKTLEYNGKTGAHCTSSIFFFVVLFITCFRLNTRCTYDCIGTSGKNCQTNAIKFCILKVGVKMQVLSI